jgi:hypothetical protein
MNPNPDGRHYLIIASGLFVRTGEDDRYLRDISSFVHFPPRTNDQRPTGLPKNQSPYPGIHIGSGNELLDFRFEDTEILQEREE